MLIFNFPPYDYNICAKVCNMLCVSGVWRSVLFFVFREAYLFFLVLINKNIGQKSYFVILFSCFSLNG